MGNEEEILKHQAGNEAELLELRSEVALLRGSVEELEETVAGVEDAGRRTDLQARENLARLDSIHGIEGIMVDGNMRFIGQGIRWERPFDIYDIGAGDKVKIKDNGGKTKQAWIAGVKTTVDDGLGMTYDTDHWTLDASLSADAEIYVILKRSDNTATINIAATLPDGDDDEEVFPLWGLVWDGTNSRLEKAIDRRESYHWVAGA